MSDSSSDDDAPIASRLNNKAMEESSGDSSSDDDIPINQLKRCTTAMDVSSSDDDAPLIKRNTNSHSHKRRESISSSDSPLVSKKQRKRKRKRHNRFNDSDESDDDDDDDMESNSSSDDDEPIVKATEIIKRPPRKKARRNTNRNNYYSSSSVSPSTPRRSSSGRRKKGSTSSPGYIGRECFPAASYAKKRLIAPLKPLQGALKWWEHEKDSVVSYSKSDDSKSKKKWNTLDHNGIVFAPPYVGHKIPILYDGKSINLTVDQEEIATFFAIMIETDWAQKEKFRRNFFREFQKILRDKSQARTFPQIVSLDKCDFRAIYEWSIKKKEEEKEKKKDKKYKLLLKENKDKIDSLYGYALVDGILEKVGNYKVEPPGLFRGRGEHPKMGMLKKRILPSNIILNIGENTAIPPCPIAGQEWGGVIHDKTVTYIAKWVENINGSHKFVYLDASSRFKGQNDRNKYEKARVLKNKILAIRSDYESKLTSANLTIKQLSTAVWMIDKLSIRVGNEKDTDEEADTVGVCSLRKEHITLLDVDGEKYRITLDFLGKDSMRYHQTVSVTAQIYANLQQFLHTKKDDMDIFEKIDPNKVNDYLRQQMEGLTAKVFRTHNASTTLENELAKGHHPNVGKISARSSIDEKIFFYNQCNMMVAILCNHQRSVSKTHAEQLEKIDKQIQDIKDLIEEMQEELDIKQGKKRKKKKKKKKKVKTEGAESPKKKKKEKSAEQLTKQIIKKKEMLRKKELQKAMKEDNKEVALGTSKINYMDPRITVAWCKKMQVPIEKIFNKSLLNKFPWAMQSQTTYQF